VHALTENKNDDEAPWENFVRIFQSKVVKEDILKWIIGNESLNEISNDNGVR